MEKGSVIHIIGGGICGCLLSIRLVQQGHQVFVYEKRKDYRMTNDNENISINLALSARGIDAIQKIGDFNLMERVKEIMIPMHGRMIHDLNGEQNFQSYSKDGKNHINSISRGDLNNILLDYAEEKGVTFFFESKIERLNHRSKTFWCNDELVNFDVCFGTDGARSVARLSLINMPLFNLSQKYSEHGYKELIMPADENGDFKMDKNSLHIWPRGTYMLIGLPNNDGSYTCTLFMPLPMFDQLNDVDSLRSFFEENYPDILPLLPNLEIDYFKNPTGTLMTVKCFPWTSGDALCLMGDAAHAVVPFFGQGLNASMQDVTVFMEIMEKVGTENGWEPIFKEFEKIRSPDAFSIADMAEENYFEMRDHVNSEEFQFRKAVIHHLGRSFPNLFNSRYEEVSFSTIPYSLCVKKGKIISEIVDELTQGMDFSNPEAIDLELAKRLIEEKLVPLNDPKL